MNVSKETEQKIQQLQLIEQSMQQFLMQKQSFQTQLVETESALKELKNSEKAYKIIGNIMVSSKKADLEKDLKSKKETLSKGALKARVKKIVITIRFVNLAVFIFFIMLTSFTTLFPINEFFIIDLFFICLTNEQ